MAEERKLWDEAPAPAYTAERCEALKTRYLAAQMALDNRVKTQLIVELKRELGISHHGDIASSLNAIALKLTVMKKAILLREKGIRRGVRVLKDGRVAGEVLGITEHYNVAVRYADGSRATLHPIAVEVG